MDLIWKVKCKWETLISSDIFSYLLQHDYFYQCPIDILYTKLRVLYAIIFTEHPWMKVIQFCANKITFFFQKGGDDGSWFYFLSIKCWYNHSFALLVACLLHLMQLVVLLLNVGLDGRKKRLPFLLKRHNCNPKSGLHLINCSLLSTFSIVSKRKSVDN